MASNTVKLVLTLKDNASKGLKGVAGSASKASVSVGGVTKAFGAVGLAAAAAGAAFVKMGQDVANQINQISDLSNITGVSVNTLEDLKLMAGSTGLQFKDMEKGVVKFTDSLGKAKRDASGTQAGVFAELGLDPNQFKDGDAALRATVKQLNSMEDQALKVSIAQEIFGSGGQKMLKAMQTSFEGAAYANDTLNLRMGESTDEAAEMQRALALQDGVMQRLKLTAFNAFTGEGGFAHGIAVVTGIIGGLMKLLQDLGKLIINIFKATSSLVQQLHAVGTMDWEGYLAAVNDGSSAISNITEAVADIVTLDFVQDGVDEYLNFQEAMEALGKSVDETNEDIEEQARLAKEAAEALRLKEEAEKREAERAKKAKIINDKKRESLEAFIQSLKDQRQALYKTAHGLRYFGQAQTAATEEFFDGEEAVSEYASSIEDLAKRFEQHQGTWGYTERQLLEIGQAAKGNAKEFKAAAAAYSEWVGSDVVGGISSKRSERDQRHIGGDMPALIEQLSQHRRRGGYESDIRDDLDSLIEAAMLFTEAQEILDAPESPISIAKMDAVELGSALSDAQSELESSARHAQDLAVIWGDLASLEIGVGAEFEEVEEKIREVYRGAGKGVIEPLINELKTAFKSGGDLRTIMSEAIGEGFEDIEIKKAKIDEIEAQKSKVEKQEARLAKIESIEGTIRQITGITSGALSGDIMGATSQALMSSGNPYAAGAGAAVGAFAELSELGQLAKDSSVQEVADTIVKSAEDSLEGISAGIDVLEKILPDLIVMILADLPLAIIKAIPQLALAMTEAFMSAMLESFGWMAKAWEQIKAWFGRTKEERKEDRAEAWEATKGWFEGVFQGMGDSYQEGYDSYPSGTGYVGKTGMALLHKGEAVIPVNGRGPQGVTAGGSPVNINISASVIDRDVIPRLVREIEKVTGRFGRMSASFA